MENKKDFSIRAETSSNTYRTSLVSINFKNGQSFLDTSRLILILKMTFSNKKKQYLKSLSLLPTMLITKKNYPQALITTILICFFFLFCRRLVAGFCWGDVRANLIRCVSTPSEKYNRKQK